MYQDYGLKDKERYKREMQEYKEKLKLSQPLSKDVIGDSGPSDARGTAADPDQSQVH